MFDMFDQGSASDPHNLDRYSGWNYAQTHLVMNLQTGIPFAFRYRNTAV
jgi:hypothetical protein